MIIFLDTFAWIKYFLAEAGTTAVQDFLLQQYENGMLVRNSQPIEVSVY